MSTWGLLLAIWLSGSGIVAGYLQKGEVTWGDWELAKVYDLQQRIESMRSGDDTIGFCGSPHASPCKFVCYGSNNEDRYKLLSFLSHRGLCWRTESFLDLLFHDSPPANSFGVALWEQREAVVLFARWYVEGGFLKSNTTHSYPWLQSYSRSIAYIAEFDCKPETYPPAIINYSIIVTLNFDSDPRSLARDSGFSRLFGGIGGLSSVKNTENKSDSLNSAQYDDYASKYIEAIRVAGNRYLYIQIGFLIFIIIAGGFCGYQGFLLVESGDNSGLVLIIGSSVGIISTVSLMALGYVWQL